MRVKTSLSPSSVVPDASRRARVISRRRRLAVRPSTHPMPTGRKPEAATAAIAVNATAII